MGYESLYEPDTNQIKSVYQLTPKPDKLDAVNLYEPIFSRKEMLKVFKLYFLGTGRAERKSEILNIDDVILYYISKENTLYAKSFNPIIVQNDYLGYKIKFDLKAFEVKFKKKSLDKNDYKQSFFAGFSFFEDIKPEQIDKRTKTYIGSINHFFKNLTEKYLKKTKYKLAYLGHKFRPKRVFDVQNINDDIYQIKLKQRAIKFEEGKYVPTVISVSHKNKESIIEFKKTFLRVDKFGNIIDLKNLIFRGDFANYKVAKMLPVNFTLEND